MTDRLTPLRHRRATGETRLGTKSDPVAESSNPAVKRFKRGGPVEGSMNKKVSATTTVGDGDTRAMSESAKKGGPIHRKKGGKAEVSREGKTGVGALAKADMSSGNLPKGDEFKRGGKAHFAEGGSVTKGVGRW